MKRLALLVLALLACGDDVVEGEPTIQITNPAAQGASDAGATPEDAGEDR
jgi:hypothetical protein